MISTARGMCLESKVQPIQFMLTIDEADDFYRTDGEDHEIKMEEQLRELKDIGPLVQFEVELSSRSNRTEYRSSLLSRFLARYLHRR